MAYYSIQISPGADAEPFGQVITLDGSKYLFRFRWAGRANAWILDIHDDQDVELVAGMAMLLSADLLRPYNDARLPPGKLSVVDVDSTGTDAAMGDLGGRVQLFYIDAATAAEIEATAAA